MVYFCFSWVLFNCKYCILLASLNIYLENWYGNFYFSPWIIKGNFWNYYLKNDNISVICTWNWSWIQTHIDPKRFIHTLFWHIIKKPGFKHCKSPRIKLLSQVINFVPHLFLEYYFCFWSLNSFLSLSLSPLLTTKEKYCFCFYKYQLCTHFISDATKIWWFKIFSCVFNGTQNT